MIRIRYVIIYFQEIQERESILKYETSNKGREFLKVKSKHCFKC